MLEHILVDTGELDEKTFLEQLRQHFPISSIFYPGCGYDVILEEVFEPEKIVYLDRGRYALRGAYPFLDHRENGCNLVLGDYGRAPFKDHVFDAIFYQDNHADVDQTTEILRTLRPSGIIIHSSYTGDCIDAEQFARLPSLRKINLPFYNRYYRVFQKC